jgi:archaellum component FlaC
MFTYHLLDEKLKKDPFASKTIPNCMFAPRIIDKETVEEVINNKDSDWGRFTNYLEDRCLRDIIGSLGSTEDEKYNVINMLRQASGSTSLVRWNDRPEKVYATLDVIEKEIRLQYNHEASQAISEAEIAEREKSIVPAPYEARIKELEMEVESLTSENKELKKQQPTERPAEDDIESLKQQISELKMEIADMEKREGLDAPKAALLVRIACTKLGGMPNNRENAWPLISNLWGTAEASARKRLRERVKEETVEDLASLFDSVSPKIAGIIREEGKVIIEKQKKVK